MIKSRINKDEVLQAMRQAGYGRTSEVGAVVLETSGNLSVLTKIGEGEDSTLPGLKS